MATKVKVGLIYRIRNVTNGHYYIGSTNSLALRRNVHLSALRRQRHHSVVLQRAFNKYGENSLVFEVMEDGVPLNELLIKEQEYLDKFKPKYNTNRVAGKPPTYDTFSPESKAKCAAGTRKIIVQYRVKEGFRLRDRRWMQSRDGLVYVREWNSLRLASQTLGIANSAITECCRGKIKSAGGFVFKYRDNFIPYNPPSYARFTKQERSERMGVSSSRIYSITTPTGEKTLVRGLKKYCEENNLNVSSMYNLVTGFKKIYRGYKVRRLLEETA